MIARDKPALRRALLTLAEIHGRELTPEMLEAYFDALQTLPIQNVERAIKRATAESAFWPKPAELRELAQSADDRRPPPREYDGVPAYACPDCQDRGILIRKRYVGDRCVGEFARPCGCGYGGGVAQAWEKPGGHGRSLADTARDNVQRLANLERAQAERTRKGAA